MVSRAISSMRCSPPESSPAAVRRRSLSRGKRSYTSAKARRTARRPPSRIQPPSARFLLDRHGGKDAMALEQIRDATPKHILRRNPVENAAIEQNFALARPQIAEDRLEQSGFARAIRSDDQSDKPVARGEIDPVKNGDLPRISGDQPFRLEHPFSSPSCPDRLRSRGDWRAPRPACRARLPGRR